VGALALYPESAKDLNGFYGSGILPPLIAYDAWSAGAECPSSTRSPRCASSARA
jgi:hypothetical protein